MNNIESKIEKLIPSVMDYYGLIEVPKISYFNDKHINSVARTVFEDTSVEFNIANLLDNKSDTVLNEIIMHYLTKEQCQVMHDNYVEFVVAHEFCHVKQMRHNKMYVSKDKYRIVWADTGLEYRVPWNVIDYVNLPWEKEANIEANNYLQMVTNGR